MSKKARPPSRIFDHRLTLKNQNIPKVYIYSWTPFKELRITDRLIKCISEIKSTKHDNCWE